MTRHRPTRIANKGAAQAAFDRWLIFSNGKEKSDQWPWGDNTRVELPTFKWPTKWDYAGVIREIRYTSDKVMPENPSGDLEEYIHDFASEELRKHPTTYSARRLEPFVEVFTPAGRCPYGDPATLNEINRKSFRAGKAARFPDELAFLAKCDGWSVSPPGVLPTCGPSKAVEAHVKNCLLCASPEGDMLVVIDLGRAGQVAMVAYGPTLKVEESGIDD